MSTFIELAACRGRRPQGLVARVHHPRSELVARLLKERRVARFLVAPDGFGKTSLAYAYADVVFSFAHVFWLSCRSPCFLRDLDAGRIGSDVLRLDESASLVVFEDLPRLDAERAASFSGLLDALLGRGIEVIVSCAPSCDVYGGLQQGRLVLAGADLLLTPAEWRVSLRGEDADADGSVPPAAERVACLRWKDAGEADLLAGLRREELPSDLLLAVFALLALGEGELDDLGVFLSAGRQRTEEVVELLARGYPFLGVERRDGSFSAARVSVGCLAEAMGPLFDLLAQASAFEGRDALAGRFADALVVRGEHARAMELVLAFSTKQGASSWAALRGWRYLADGHPLPLRRACDALARSSFKKSPSYNALAAWAACELADAAGAASFARRAAFGQATPRAEALLSCALLLREGAQEQHARVLQVLEARVSRSSGNSDAAGESTAGEWLDAEALGRLRLPLAKGRPSGLRPGSSWRRTWKLRARVPLRGKPRFSWPRAGFSRMRRPAARGCGRPARHRPGISRIRKRLTGTTCFSQRASPCPARTGAAGPPRARAGASISPFPRWSASRRRCPSCRSDRRAPRRLPACDASSCRFSPSGRTTENPAPGATAR